MYGPILEGKTKVGQRVVLRPPTENDAPLLIRWMADLDVTRTLGRLFPLSLGAEKEWLAKEADNPRSVLWIIEHQSGRQMVPVGVTGIHQVDPIHHHATTGTFIGDKSRWRMGIGSTAMHLRTEFAFIQMNLHKLHSSFLAGNEGSRRAQLAAGYQIVGQRKETFWRNGEWVDEVLTEVMAADWFASHKSNT